MLSPTDLEWLSLRLEIATEDTRRLGGMSLRELKEALSDVSGIDQLTIGYSTNGNQVLNLGDLSVEVSPMASNDEIRAALSKPTLPTRNTKVTMSAIDRIKAKALQAKAIVPEAIKSVEDDLDSLIAEKAKLEDKKAKAMAPHLEAISGLHGELDGLKSALDILSNGGPPLTESESGSGS